MAALSTVWKETHAYSLNGIHLIWQYLHDLPKLKLPPNIPRIWYYYCVCNEKSPFLFSVGNLIWDLSKCPL